MVEKINGRKLVVVGYYDSKYNYNYYFVNDNTIKYNLIKALNYIFFNVKIIM